MSGPMKKTESFVVTIPISLKSEFDKFVKTFQIDYAPEGKPAAEEAFVRGDYKPGEKPSDFAGAWSARNKGKTLAQIREEVMQDAERIREEAWQRKD